MVGVPRGTIPESLLGRQCRQGSAGPTVGCVFTAPALPTPGFLMGSRCVAEHRSSQCSKYLVLYDMRKLNKKLHFQLYFYSRLSPIVLWKISLYICDALCTFSACDFGEGKPRLKLRPPKSRPGLVDILSAQPPPQREPDHMKIMR